MKKDFLLLFVAGLGCLLWSACQKTDAPAPRLAAVSYGDVKYGNDPLQDLDVFLPEGRDTASTPLLILIHGGAWFSGDKSDFQPYVDSIKALFPDYAVANLNYRLAEPGVNLFPTQENDVNKAVHFLSAKTGEYHISKQFIYLGASAGGHLALLQAYKYAVAQPAAVISFFGPADMADLYYHSPDTLVTDYLPLLMGGTPTQNPSLYRTSSPIHYVSTRAPATLLFQGGEDQLVPFREAFQLNDSLEAAGVVHELVFYPHEGHGWTGRSLQDSFEKIAAFLHQNIR